MIKYNEIDDKVLPNMFISFREYTWDRHQRKELTLDIQSQEVIGVIQPNQPMERTELEAIYGRDMEDIDYLALSRSSNYRLILQIVDVEHPEKGAQYRVISLNKDFMNMGLQELELVSLPQIAVGADPNMLLDSERGGIKGFSDYQVGAALFKNITKNS